MNVPYIIYHSKDTQQPDNYCNDNNCIKYLLNSGLHWYVSVKKYNVYPIPWTDFALI